MTHKNAPKNFQLPKTFLILSKKKYSRLNLNQYSVASPCRTDLNLIHYILRPLQNSFPSRQPKPKHRFSSIFAPNTS
ncbi:hypothetical protein FGF64_04410 [Neisseria meningitidis]|nr:hypothetical protein [Neisseria meningitidis]